MSKKRYQVVIVGGGPVGVGLAIELGLRGISVVLVERYQQLLPIPKGQNLTQRTLEHFYFWGIEDDLRAERVMPPGYPASGITAYGDLNSPYWYPWFNRASVRPYYFTDNERLPQYATEKVLREHMATLPNVDSHFGWSAEKIEQDDTGVRVTILERDGSGEQILKADYVVGCDGSHSTVREQVGIEQTISQHNKLMALIVFRSTALHEKLKRFPESAIYRVLNPELDGYWRFFGRVDVGEGWFFHAPIPPNMTRETFDPATCLYQATGFEFPCEFDYVGFWDLRVAVANSYQKGRVFIAGDACHSHPPYGGYGVNTGLEDARNLGWKLAATLQGWGNEALLDSYSAERLPVFQSTASDFIEKYIDNARSFFERYDPDENLAAFERAWADMGTVKTDVQAFVPHYEGSPLVDGPEGAVSGAKGQHTRAARAGHHLAPQGLSSGKDVFEELGEWFSLLAFDADDATIQAFDDAAQRLNIPLKIIREPDSERAAPYESRLILVRPDQFIAWVGNENPDHADAILKQAIGLSLT